MPQRRFARITLCLAIVLITLDVMTVFTSVTVKVVQWGQGNVAGISIAGGGVLIQGNNAPGDIAGHRWFGSIDRPWWYEHHWMHVRGMWSLGTLVPLWFAWLPMLGVVGVSMWREQRRMRILNACPHFTYSLTGLPPGAACPECGKASMVEQTVK